MRVLLTRPEPDLQRTAAALRQRGHLVLSAPLLHIATVPADVGQTAWDAVLMTSANAARAIGANPAAGELYKLPAFVVGHRSAEVALEAGFRNVVSAGGGVKELASLAAGRFAGQGANLLYLCGQQRSGDLAGELANAGLAVHTVEIYQAIAAERFPREIAEALSAGAIDAVLHFSRRTAEIYCQCATRNGLLGQALRPMHCCLAEPVAGPLRAAGARGIAIAQSPDEKSLLGLLEGSNRLLS